MLMIKDIMLLLTLKVSRWTTVKSTPIKIERFLRCSVSVLQNRYRKTCILHPEVREQKLRMDKEEKGGKGRSGNKVGLPWWLSRLSPPATQTTQETGVRSIPGSGRSQRKKWQPIPVFLPGKPCEERSLVGYGPEGHKESDTIEQTSTQKQGAGLAKAVGLGFRTTKVVWHSRQLRTEENFHYAESEKWILKRTEQYLKVIWWGWVKKHYPGDQDALYHTDLLSLV